MKRFYCTVCKRVKRVRRIPLNVVSPNAEIVTERTGECSYHADGYVRRTRVAKPIKQVTIQVSKRKVK
jgi:hypothetical protein